MSSDKLIYIDNLRIFVISLVVAVHVALFYMPLGWYSCKENAEPIIILILTAFIIVIQAFFMGLLFLISAYFTNHSFNKGNIHSVLAKRFMRLGIPLLFYLLIISPIVHNLIALLNPDSGVSFWHIWLEPKSFALGPLWFVAALLFFTLLYTSYRIVAASNLQKNAQPYKIPNVWIIMLFAFVLGIVAFVTRIWFPIGNFVPIIGFQLAHFPQYICMFIIGIIAHKYQWLNSINFKTSVKWLLFALVMILFSPLLIYYFAGAAFGGIGNTIHFLGGGHMPSLIYSIWEQITGIALMIGLLGVFKRYLNQPSQLNKWLSNSTYTVYIIHPPIIIFLCWSLNAVALPALVKFVVLLILALLICFILASLICKIPVVKNVLQA